MGSVAKFIRPLSVRRRLKDGDGKHLPELDHDALDNLDLFRNEFQVFSRSFYASSPVQELHGRKSVLVDLLFLT